MAVQDRRNKIVELKQKGKGHKRAQEREAPYLRYEAEGCLPIFEAMYDLIGDIHGHVEALRQLLHKMDYQEKNGVWQHPSQKVIFVGDYIDRVPAIRETLQIVRTMQETGHAIT